MQATVEKQTVLDLLEENGHQVTPQREYVIDKCLERGGHFTVEDLYTDNYTEEVDLSRATLYNTLHLLVDVGFLRELPDVDDSAYYELNGKRHPHASCNECGKLIDIPVDLEEEIREWDLGFTVSNVRMTVDGLCDDCSKQSA